MDRSTHGISLAIAKSEPAAAVDSNDALTSDCRRNCRFRWFQQPLRWRVMTPAEVRIMVLAARLHVAPKTNFPFRFSPEARTRCTAHARESSRHHWAELRRHSFRTICACARANRKSVGRSFNHRCVPPREATANPATTGGWGWEA